MPVEITEDQVVGSHGSCAADEPFELLLLQLCVAGDLDVVVPLPEPRDGHRLEESGVVIPFDEEEELSIRHARRLGGSGRTARPRLGRSP